MFEIIAHPELFQRQGAELGYVAGRVILQWGLDSFYHASIFERSRMAGNAIGYVTSEVIIGLVAPEAIIKIADVALNAIKDTRFVESIVQLIEKSPEIRQLIEAKGFSASNVRNSKFFEEFSQLNRASHSSQEAISVGGGRVAEDLETGKELETASKSSPAISSEAVPMASELIGKGDKLAKAAEWIKPEPGFYDVIVHGSSDVFHVLHNGEWVSVNHRSLANFMQQTGYSGGPIRLISCSSGADTAGVAKNLANKLGTTVMAPTHTVWIWPNGRLVIGPNPAVNMGTWRKFFPGKP
jgi:hypothetical protein